MSTGHASPIQDLLVDTDRFEHTVAVRVAPLFAAPKARAPRKVVRANIVGELGELLLMYSTPEVVEVEGSSECGGGSLGRSGGRRA